MTPDPQEWTETRADPPGQDLQEALAAAAHRVRPRADAWSDNRARLHRRRARRRYAAVAAACAAVALAAAGATVVLPAAHDAQRIEPATAPPSAPVRGLPTWNPIVYPELTAPVIQSRRDGRDTTTWLVVGRPNLAHSFFTPPNPNEPPPFPELRADDLVTCVGEGTARSEGDVGLSCIPGQEPVPGRPYMSSDGWAVPGRPEVTRWIVAVRPDIRSIEVVFGTTSSGRGEVTGVLPATRLGPGSLTRIRIFTVEAPAATHPLGYRAVLDDGRRDHFNALDLVNPPPD